MIHEGRTLTPAPSYRAGPDNYTGLWKPGLDYPRQAGYVFDNKLDFMTQIREDHPGGVPAQVLCPTRYGVGQNTVIGGPGFGWEWANDRWLRFPHIAHVRIGRNVEIGSNCTIDRGSLDDTVLEDGVKLDNGVHVGHSAYIGKHSLLTAHCVIGGSAVIGEKVWVGLGAQIRNHVHVGSGAVIGMGAIVVKDVPPGATVVGNPARPLSS